MKPSDIKEGKTYRNRGAGTTKRTVLKIGRDLPCTWWSNRPRPNEPGVLYAQGNNERLLTLSSFAKWAGSEVA